MLIASTHGKRLSARRYYSGTDRLVAEASAREKWTIREWQDWQQERLVRMLNISAKKVPYYRKYWEERRRRGDGASQESLENWPVITKEIIRERPREFILDDVDLRSQIIEHTSGTTGKPLILWFSKNAVRQHYALFEARWRGWYGISRNDRWGMLGGQLVVPFVRKRPPFWVWNAGLNQLYLSSYHLAPSNIAAYVDALRRHRVIYLFGYASSLYALAQTAKERSIRLPKMKAIISNAEPLYTHQKKVISGEFNCAVYNTYGLSECVCAASECSAGNMHLWPEEGVTEVLEDDSDSPSMPGKVGRLICTGLINQTMPLIRYQNGDRASIADPTNSCSCGREMPILSGIEGRMDDVIITSDHRLIGRLDPVFKADIPIFEAQIIQESMEQLRVKYVPAVGFSEKDAVLLVNRIQERVGNMKVIIEEVASIPRTKNGKFRAVLSNIARSKHQ
jgi:phenylacetate-CoA ligase